MVLGYKHNISCSFRYHHPGQSETWNQRAYGADHFPRGVGVNLSFWSWWQDSSHGQALTESIKLKNLLDHRWLFTDTPTTPERLIEVLHRAANASCLGLCLIENEYWAVASDRKSTHLIYREKDFAEQKEFHFMKAIDQETGLLLNREEARQKAKDYCEKNTGFTAPLVGYRQQRQVRPQFIGQNAEAVQHGVLFSFPVVWP